jgi:thiol-disulfide isomerase/thioredoxin
MIKMKKKIRTSMIIVALTIFSLFTFGQSVPAELETNIIDLNSPEYANTSFDDIIAKYEGKVIYLDFWASWCGPCKREMPYSHKMQETFLGKDVVFVYISSDKNASAWASAVDNLKLTGEHYLASLPVKQDYGTRFNVRFIPRYILIDKKGNVVDENAKRPSDPQTVNDIEALL